MMQYIPGELVELRMGPGTATQDKSDKAISDKYSRGEVRIVTEQARYPLSSIVTMLESGDYELNPEFQRRFRWDRTKQSRLIESFVMNVPIPPIFLYEDRFSHYEVMDGLQRLTAIFEFYTNQFELEGLEEWSELNGRKYHTLPEVVRRGVDRRFLSSVILLQETAKSEVEAQSLKQLVFERINSGGEKLEGQESRNAIYNGPLNRLCIELSRNPYLCRTWAIPEADQQEIERGVPSRERLDNPLYRKMHDVELVLRFFAFRQRLEHEWSSLGRYLDSYLNAGNRYSRETLAQLGGLFERTIELAYKLFGDRAFYMERERAGSWHWTTRPVMVVYDALMYVLSGYVDRSDELIRARGDLSARLQELYRGNVDRFAGRDVNKTDFEARVGLLTQLVEQQLES